LNTIGEGVERKNLNSFDHRCFLGVVSGKQETSIPRISCSHGNGKCASDWLHLSVKRQLTQNKIMGQLTFLNHLCGCEDANGHGEVESGPFLLDIRRRQVDRNPLGGKIIAAVLNGCLDPVLGFFDRTFREPDGCEGGKALGNVHLHLYDVGIDSKNSAAQNLG